MRCIGLLIVAACAPTEPDTIEPDEPVAPVARVVGWGAPIRIPVSQPGATDIDPAISADGSELFFSTNRDDPADPRDDAQHFRIYTAVWFPDKRVWSGAVAVPTLWPADAKTTSDTGPELSQDGLTIWFSRRTDAGASLLYTATRTSRRVAWDSPRLVAELDMPARSPNVSRDGLKLYFQRADAIPYHDIYFVTRPTENDTWRNVRAVNRFNSDDIEDGITTARGDLEAYFMRGGTVYRSTRPDTETAWSWPEVVDDLPGVYHPDVTPDGLHMVMTMIPNGGDHDIYEATRAF